ncbi:glutaredoxin family protein [Brevibacterium zhoupengii]|uniref:glutaredoxin family protein n=1 Tax=Brevibacterium zhoupengii TaxID=2898795 RepID=UPI001F09D83C|nr:glutaredoxin family protein [Brevibacterium zhoupengii]
MAITIYESPNCSGCRLTKVVLNRESIPYQTVDLSTDLDAYRAVKALGHKQAPVVGVTYPDGTEEHWGGLRPDKLNTYITAVKGAQAA